MVHSMKLNAEPFYKIREGKKTVELRLLDNKRRVLDVGDKIVFTNLADENEQMAVTWNLDGDKVTSFMDYQIRDGK